MEDLKMELFEDVSFFCHEWFTSVISCPIKNHVILFLINYEIDIFQGEQFPNQQIIKSGLPVTHYVNHHNHNYQTYQTYETLELYEVKHETDSHDSKHIIQQNRERYIYLIKDFFYNFLSYCIHCRKNFAIKTQKSRYSPVQVIRR